jgi:hypothetical protein
MSRTTAPQQGAHRQIDGVRVHGGGARTGDGFFPGLVEGLTADPGVRVIAGDRVGSAS